MTKYYIYGKDSNERLGGTFKWGIIFAVSDKEAEILAKEMFGDLAWADRGDDVSQIS